MSKLLIDERPLVVLPSLAKLLGLNQAMLLQQIHFWQSTARQMGPRASSWTTTHDGEIYIKATLDEWINDNFPFWSLSTLKRVMLDLASKSCIKSVKPTAHRGDHAKYYAVDHAGLDSLKLGRKVTQNHDKVKMNQSNGSNRANHDWVKMNQSTIKERIVETKSDVLIVYTKDQFVNAGFGPKLDELWPYFEAMQLHCDMPAYDTFLKTCWDLFGIIETIAVDEIIEYAADLRESKTDVWPSDILRYHRKMYRSKQNGSSPNISKTQLIGVLRPLTLKQRLGWFNKQNDSTRAMVRKFGGDKFLQELA